MNDVTVYLKNGAEITFECKSFETTRDCMQDGYSGYAAEGLKEGCFVSFKTSEIVAWTSNPIKEG